MRNVATRSRSISRHSFGVLYVLAVCVFCSRVGSDDRASAQAPSWTSGLPSACAALAGGRCGGGSPGPGVTCDGTGTCCAEWCVLWSGTRLREWGQTCAPTLSEIGPRVQRAQSRAQSYDRFFGAATFEEEYSSPSAPFCGGCGARTGATRTVTRSEVEADLRAAAAALERAAASPPYGTGVTVVGHLNPQKDDASQVSQARVVM